MLLAGSGSGGAMSMSLSVWPEDSERLQPQAPRTRRGSIDPTATVPHAGSLGGGGSSMLDTLDVPLFNASTTSAGAWSHSASRRGSHSIPAPLHPQQQHDLSHAFAAHGAGHHSFFSAHASMHERDQQPEASSSSLEPSLGMLGAPLRMSSLGLSNASSAHASGRSTPEPLLRRSLDRFSPFRPHVPMVSASTTMLPSSHSVQVAAPVLAAHASSTPAAAPLQISHQQQSQRVSGRKRAGSVQPVTVSDLDGVSESDLHSSSSSSDEDDNVNESQQDIAAPVEESEVPPPTERVTSFSSRLRPARVRPANSRDSTSGSSAFNSDASSESDEHDEEAGSDDGEEPTSAQRHRRSRAKVHNDSDSSASSSGDMEPRRARRGAAQRSQRRRASGAQGRKAAANKVASAAAAAAAVAAVVSPTASPKDSPVSSTGGGGDGASAMECGTVRNGVRVLSEVIPFFGKEVELYTAVSDPLRRVLVRASTLAERFGCATNKVGMYLSRRRHLNQGLFQATSFSFKPAGRTGLKAGGYFLSQEVCEGFREHFEKHQPAGGYANAGVASPTATTTTAAAAAADDKNVPVAAAEVDGGASKERMRSRRTAAKKAVAAAAAAVAAVASSDAEDESLPSAEREASSSKRASPTKPRQSPSTAVSPRFPDAAQPSWPAPGNLDAPLDVNVAAADARPVSTPSPPVIASSVAAVAPMDSSSPLATETVSVALAVPVAAVVAAASVPRKRVRVRKPSASIGGAVAISGAVIGQSSSAVATADSSPRIPCKGVMSKKKPASASGSAASSVVGAGVTRKKKTATAAAAAADSSSAVPPPLKRAKTFPPPPSAPAADSAPLPHTILAAPVPMRPLEETGNDKCSELDMNSRRGSSASFWTSSFAGSGSTQVTQQTGETMSLPLRVHSPVHTGSVGMSTLGLLDTPTMGSTEHHAHMSSAAAAPLHPLAQQQMSLYPVHSGFTGSTDSFSPSFPRYLPPPPPSQASFHPLPAQALHMSSYPYFAPGAPVSVPALPPQQQQQCFDPSNPLSGLNLTGEAIEALQAKVQAALRNLREQEERKNMQAQAQAQTSFLNNESSGAMMHDHPASSSFAAASSSSSPSMSSLQGPLLTSQYQQQHPYPFTHAGSSSALASGSFPFSRI